MESKIRQLWASVQRGFAFEDDSDLCRITKKHMEVITVLDFLDVAQFFNDDQSFLGRPKKDRCALACAFVAKAVLNLQNTEALIDRLHADKVLRRICVFDPTKKIPCRATFSNAFAAFAKSGLASKLHKKIIQNNLGNRLIGHVSRDSTPIEARETIPPKKKERWRRLKGKKRRLVKQKSMTLSEMINDLPKNADLGRKNGFSWKGYKLHLDVVDGDIPVSVILTSASVHDSQASIPLEKLTAEKLTSLYTLMDSAYDAKEIREQIAGIGKVAIICPQKREPQLHYLDPAEKKRLQERNGVERVNSRIKDRFGGRSVWVKGPEKVMAHCMFGICALTALQLLKLL